MNLRIIALPFIASTLFACGGTVETIGGGDGDGDSTRGGDGDGDGDGDRGGTIPGPPGGGGVEPTPVGEPPVVGGGGGGVIGPGGVVLEPGTVTQLPPVDPATCEEGYDYNDGNYCEREAYCGNTYAYAWCDSYDSGDAQCWCDRDGIGINVTLDGNVGDGQACDRVMDACLGATGIAVTGEPVCVNEYLEQGEDYCSTNLNCQTPVEVGGLPANVQSWSDTWCDYWDGQWSCECYSGNSSGRVVFEDRLESPDVCYSSIDACRDGIIDPAQPADCSPRSQWAEADYCNFELECSQSRTIDGFQAQVSAWQYGSCTPAGNGSWSCSCGNGDSFTLDGDSAWSVCTTAAGRCGD